MKPQHGRQSRVSFGESRVELQGGHRLGFRARERFLGRQIAVPSEKHVGIGDARIGEGVVGIFFGCLLEMLDRLVETFLRPAIPVMKTFQVELIRLGIFRGVCCEALLLRAGDLQLQFPRYLGGDFVLEGEDVAGLAVVLRAPELRASGYVDELSRNAQGAASLHDSSREDGADVQLAADGLRSNFAAAISKDRALRHHAQFRYGRQRVDEAACDAVAEVFVLGIAAGVFEGQDCERVDNLSDALLGARRLARTGEVRVRAAS